MRQRSRYLEIIGVVLCLAAGLISYKLLAKHITGASGSAWFDAGCRDDAPAGGADCAAVLASPYAYWPPKKPDERPNTPHIPVAFFGLIYFSSLAVWILGVGRPSRQRRWIHLLPLLVIICGLAGSARFLYIMFTMLEEWCPWCLATHLLNALIALCVFLMWPRREAVPGEAETCSTDEVAPTDVHPSWSRILGTVGVIVVVTYGNYGQSATLAVRKTRLAWQQCLGTVKRIQGDTAQLVRNWGQAPAQPITVRADDPVRTSTPATEKTLEVVVFSDFECPSCSRFAPFLEEQVLPLFGGRVRTVFKHYPIDQSCNEHTSRTLHPHACQAARLVEAARLQGGNETFWRAHDLLFAHRRRHSAQHAPDVEGIASALGLDVERLKQDIQSVAVAERIDEDAALARSCGVNGTPAVFIARRRVDTLALQQLEFWDRIAERFWHNIREVRPRSTTLEAVRKRLAPPTPDSQGRKDAP